MTTVLDTIDAGTRYLEKRGIADARRNMQLLVAHQLRCTRMELYMRFDRPLEEAELVPLREMLRRRGEGVPLQHLLGTVTFHRRDFRCDARALIPRPETEELAELLLKQHPPAPGARILDLGCGSGVLGLTLAAECPSTVVTLADISPDALDLARENAANLGIAGTTFVRSDLLESLTGATFDLIVANLPYVPERDRPGLARELGHEPAVALFGGPDGLAVIRRFLPAAAKALVPGGLLALEIGHDQASLVGSLLKQSGFSDFTVHSDLSGIPRFPVARAPGAGLPNPA